MWPNKWKVAEPHDMNGECMAHGWCHRPRTHWNRITRTGSLRDFFLFLLIYFYARVVNAQPMGDAIIPGQTTSFKQGSVPMDEFWAMFLREPNKRKQGPGPIRNTNFHFPLWSVFKTLYIAHTNEHDWVTSVLCHNMRSLPPTDMSQRKPITELSGLWMVNFLPDREPRLWLILQ